jgi:hypothetical protein
MQPVTARQQLRQAVLDALEGVDLTVGTATASVDSPGDWPYPQAKLPAVCVRSATDTKVPINKGGTNFTTTVEVDVRAAVCATTGEAAQADLEALWYQVEQTILQDFYLLELTQNIASIESAWETKADGQSHFAGVIGRFRFETVESFDVSIQPGPVTARPVADPIVPLTNVTVDVTRPGSDPPYSAQPGDVGLTITLPSED